MVENYNGVNDYICFGNRRGLTPLFTTNMTPYGTVQLRRERRLAMSGSISPDGGGRADLPGTQPLQPAMQELGFSVRLGDAGVVVRSMRMTMAREGRWPLGALGDGQAAPPAGGDQ
jgi:hypothetical protein